MPRDRSLIQVSLLRDGRLVSSEVLTEAEIGTRGLVTLGDFEVRVNRVVAEPARAVVRPARAARPRPAPTDAELDPVARLDRDFAAGRLRHPDDDLDDDDSSLSWVPPYSLAEVLVRRSRDALTSEVPPHERAVEVIRTRGDTVEEVCLLRPGDSYWSRPQPGWGRRHRTGRQPPRVRMFRLRRNGRLEVRFLEGGRGTVHRGGRKRTLIGEQREDRGGIYLTALEPDESLELAQGRGTWHVRFVRRDERKRDPRPLIERLAPSQLTTRSLWGSMCTHMVALLALAAVASGRPEPVEANVVEWAGALSHPELRLEEPESEAVISVPEQQPEEAAVRPTQRRPRSAARPGGLSEGPGGVLGAMQRRGRDHAPGPAAMLAAMSNVTTARSNSPNGFSMAGLEGKLPESRLSVGGGSGVRTRGLRSIGPGGGGGGKLEGDAIGEVRGLVLKAPKIEPPPGQPGSDCKLDRDAIQLVVNRRVKDIHRCYERALVQTPNLSGRVELGMHLSAAGKVQKARLVHSTLGSTPVVECMLRRVRTWRFPASKCGETVVTYPFLFESVGF